MAQVIVVGGGLAGLSAAHTLLERGANVLVLDKQPYVPRSSHSLLSCPYHFSFMGGNSTKATSGINGAGTQTQQDVGIPLLKFSLRILRNPSVSGSCYNVGSI